jgi:hypothetical protein
MALQMPRPTPVRPVPPPLNSPERQAEGKTVLKPDPVPLPKWRRGFGATVPYVVALYLCGLLIQVFLAGYGLSEVGNGGMQFHVAFAHVIEVVPLVLILVGFLGGDKVAGTVGIVLFVLFQLQYAFIGAPVAVVRALHPTNALVMFGLTLALLLKRPMWHGKAF